MGKIVISGQLRRDRTQEGKETAASLEIYFILFNYHVWTKVDLIFHSFLFFIQTGGVALCVKPRSFDPFYARGISVELRQVKWTSWPLCTFRRTVTAGMNLLMVFNIYEEPWTSEKRAQRLFVEKLDFAFRKRPERRWLISAHVSTQERLPSRWLFGGDSHGQRACPQETDRCCPTCAAGDTLPALQLQAPGGGRKLMVVSVSFHLWSLILHSNLMVSEKSAEENKLLQQFKAHSARKFPTLCPPSPAKDAVVYSAGDSLASWCFSCVVGLWLWMEQMWWSCHNIYSGWAPNGITWWDAAEASHLFLI